ncbi:MAG: hypothetical protein H7Z70_06050 [Bacteroidia bacterium]|nr:hypothetical protein [Methylotenera sp.]
MKKLINAFVCAGILLGSSSLSALGAESDNKSASPSESIKNDSDSARPHPPLKQNREMMGINGDTTIMDTDGNGIISAEEARKYNEQEQHDLELKNK